MLRFPIGIRTLIAASGWLATSALAQPVEPAAEVTPGAAEPPAPAPVAVAHPAPAEPTPALGAAIFMPSALVQVQAALLAGKQNQLERADRAEQMGFALRRGRLGLAGEFGKHTKLAVEADLARANGSDGRVDLLNEAWVGFSAWKGAEIVIGSHKVPFSRFAMLGSGDQALAERPKVVEALAPFRQVGVTVHGAYELAGLQWWLGGFNGYDRRPNFWAGVQENEGLRGNRNGGTTVAARLSAEPLGKMDRAAADHDRKGLRFELGGGAVLTEGGATTEQSYSADAHVKASGAHLLVEMLWSTTEPKTQPTTPAGAPDKVQRKSMVVEGGYMHWRFNGAVRAELVDGDTAVQDNRDEMILSAALGYQLPQNRVRVQLQFDHREERHGPAVDDDTLFLQAQVKL